MTEAMISILVKSQAESYSVQFTIGLARDILRTSNPSSSSDLPSDTNITVTVTARSSVGYSESRSIHFTTLVATATVPAPVTNLAFSFLELYSLMLTWSVPVDDGNSTILGYQIALR